MFLAKLHTRHSELHPPSFGIPNPVSANTPWDWNINTQSYIGMVFERNPDVPWDCHMPTLAPQSTPMLAYMAVPWSV